METIDDTVIARLSTAPLTVATCWPDYRETTETRRLTQYGESTWLLERDHPLFSLIQVLLGFLCLPEPVLLFTASQPSGSSFAKERSIGQHLVYQLMECHTKHLHSSLTFSKPDKLTASTLRLLTAMLMQGLAIAREIAAWHTTS